MSSTGNPWAWLGLLKWSLTYSDGTRPTDLSPMSKEDREFLEKVMREGIIDENERMKVILQQVTEQLGKWKDNPTDILVEAEERVGSLLQELRDIVEQIDYARAFAALKGIPFLLGCIQEQVIPISTRTACCGIIATMAQHNPPVQKELLEAGALKTLSDVYFNNQDEDAFQAKLIQAISAIVRQNNLAEAVFCKLDQALPLFQSSLRSNRTLVQIRALFFLSALLTSDNSDRQRTELFAPILSLVYETYLTNFVSVQSREISLSLLHQLMERGLVVLDNQQKNSIMTSAHSRVQALRALPAEEADEYATELEEWERLIVALGT